MLIPRGARPLGHDPYHALMVAIVQLAIHETSIEAVREPCIRRWCEMAGLSPAYLYRLGQQATGRDEPYQVLEECDHGN